MDMDGRTNGRTFLAVLQVKKASFERLKRDWRSTVSDLHLSRVTQPVNLKGREGELLQLLFHRRRQREFTTAVAVAVKQGRPFAHVYHTVASIPNVWKLLADDVHFKKMKNEQRKTCLKRCSYEHATVREGRKKKKQNKKKQTTLF